MEPALIPLIETIGFPAAICIALLWHHRKTIEHYERVILKFENSIEKNTNSMINLTAAIKEGQKNV